MTIDPKIQAQIDALEAAFMQARGGGDDFRTAMPNLSPELLSFLLQTEAQRDSAGNGMLRGYSDPSGAGFYQYANYAEANPGASPDASARDFDPSRVDWSQSPLQFGINTDTSNYLANYDRNGRFTGYEIAQDNNNWRDMITAALMMAPAVAGVYGWAGAAGTEGAAMSGMDLAADAALGSGNNITTAGAGLTGAGTTAGGLSGMDMAADAGMNSVNSGGGTTWGGQAATTTGTSAATKAGSTAATSAGTNAATSSGTNAATTAGTKGLMDYFTDGNLDYGKLAGGLLGAYMGYQDGKDKEQTSKTEPWSVAQPYLKGLLDEGASLFGQYKAEPFSPAEQTAYANYGNVLDFTNANAGRFMSGFDATAAGKNQFVRGQPRTLIGNSYDAYTSPVSWNPGLLGNFGTTPRKKGAL